eukprot:Colp12_sorted_trinity150504_noHs@14169
MLIYFLRNVKVALTAKFFKPALKNPFDGTMQMRVRLFDIDYNMHMNNSKYLETFEMGRVDLLMRNGFIGLVMKNGWAPIVASVKVRYIRELSFREQYTVHTKVSFWDEKWLYIEQHITNSKGKLCTTGLFKTVMWSKKGAVPTAD